MNECRAPGSDDLDMDDFFSSSATSFWAKKLHYDQNTVDTQHPKCLIKRHVLGTGVWRLCTLYQIKKCKKKRSPFCISFIVSCLSNSQQYFSSWIEWKNCMKIENFCLSKIENLIQNLLIQNLTFLSLKNLSFLSYVDCKIIKQWFCLKVLIIVE